jgi:flagellar hook-associated protein 1
VADLFNIGVSGLRTQQAALAVTGQNITNASTPGYSRQRVEIEPQNAGFKGGDFEGGGARVERITRIADEFVSNQIRLDSSMFSELESLNKQISQIEGILLDDAGGLSSALQSFFGALETATSDPSSLPFRQLVLSEAQGLTDRFHSLHARLSEQGAQVNTIMESAAARINELAGGIAELNFRIAALQNESSSGAANSLLDQRDEMLRELSTYVSVSTSESPDGQVSVFIGKGQALILGAQASQLDITSQGQVTLRSGETSERSVITSAIKGGEIGGALTFRQQVLDPALNQLGLLAHGVASSVNAVHMSGVDLNGDLGGLLFGDLNAPEVARMRALGREDNDSATGLITVTVDDPSALTLSDYELTFDDRNAGSFYVRRLSDSSVVFQGSLEGQLPQAVTFDHLTLELVSGEFNAGDSFLIRPLRDAAASFSVAMEDPALLAFAGPLRPASAAGNRGTGDIRIGEIFDQSHPIFATGNELSPPLLIRFTGENSYDVLDNSDPANPRALDPPLSGLPYDPGLVNSLLPAQPGQSLVRFAGTDIARLPVQAQVVSSLASTGNGYGAQSISVTQPGLTSSQSVALPAGSSARDIAAAMTGLTGVSASATTQLQLTQLQNNGIGTPLDMAVNGVLFTDVLSLNDLADRIAADSTLQDAGITASSDGSVLTLRSSSGDDLTVHLAGDPTDRITLLNEAGENLVLNGVGVAGEYRAATIGGTVTTLLAPGVSLSSTDGSLMQSNPQAVRADFGFSLQMTGRPQAGDDFVINFNRSGIGDNSNALQLAGLNTQRLLGDPAVSFTDSYGELVQFVGVKASQSRINRDAAQSLLEQSSAQRESISGVNLDEEAANLIKHEQAYNAAAQIISVARDIFNTLFSIVR